MPFCTRISSNRTDCDKIDLQTRIAQLKRPQLLVRAARFGVDDYRRCIHLRRILMQLLDREAELDALRLAKAGEYRPAQHVDVLNEALGEAQSMRATALHTVKTRF
jgi:hypothetical protein